LESRKSPEERLIYDPLADVLAKPDAMAEHWKNINRPKDFWIDFLATRTRWIDDRICAEAEATPDLQLVIVGAGLDTRAYRLEGLRGKKVFEVDFPEVLEAKHTILSERSVKAEPVAHRAAVGTDLSSKDDWRAAMLAAGYDRHLPSVWLLEGLTGYLTEQELWPLFQGISGLAAADSKMVATFVGDSMRVANDATHMHRYYVRDESQISELLEAHGWRANSVMQIGAIAEIYKRSENIPRDYGYYVAEAIHKPSVLPSTM